MERVEADGEWTLMCHNEAPAPGLAESWSEKFEKLYEHYEREDRGRKTIKAQKLWYMFLEVETLSS